MSVCPSLCPSARPCVSCVVNSSISFGAIELKLCTYIGYALRMWKSYASHSFQPSTPFGIPRVMQAIKSLGCNWWSNMHQVDA